MSEHTIPTPVDRAAGGPIGITLGPHEPLDDCCDCQGRVQRLARHSRGLGELWEQPLSVNTAATPMDPRRPGPGALSMAFAAVDHLRQEANA